MATTTTPTPTNDRSPLKDLPSPTRAKTNSEPLAEIPDRGKTTVSDEVITTIAQIAAQQVDGVYRLGTTGLRGMFGRIGSHPGVDSEVGMKQAAITFDVVVEFGYPLEQVAAEIRRRVVTSIEFMAHREVVAVDVNFVDVHVQKADNRQGRALE